jgi:hypothetical protein
MTLLTPLRCPQGPVALADGGDAVTGSVCIASSATKPTQELLERFVQIRGMGHLEPVLVVLGPMGALRYRRSSSLRALLDDAGFAGDRTASFCAEALDARCAAALSKVLSIEPPAACDDGRTRTAR